MRVAGYLPDTGVREAQLASEAQTTAAKGLFSALQQQQPLPPAVLVAPGVVGVHEVQHAADVQQAVVADDAQQRRRVSERGQSAPVIKPPPHTHTITRRERVQGGGGAGGQALAELGVRAQVTRKVAHAREQHNVNLLLHPYVAAHKLALDCCSSSFSSCK